MDSPAPPPSPQKHCIAPSQSPSPPQSWLDERGDENAQVRGLSSDPARLQRSGARGICFSPSGLCGSPPGGGGGGRVKGLQVLKEEAAPGLKIMSSLATGSGLPR